jgi:F-type H+-transporting ATPase subunit epsilon
MGLVLEILSPEETLFSGGVSSVKLPGALGQFEVLNLHAPIISTLTKGTIIAKTTEGETRNIEIKQGFAEVLDNKLVVLV